MMYISRSASIIVIALVSCFVLSQMASFAQPLNSNKTIIVDALPVIKNSDISWLGSFAGVTPSFNEGTASYIARDIFVDRKIEYSKEMRMQIASILLKRIDRDDAWVSAHLFASGIFPEYCVRPVSGELNGMKVTLEDGVAAGQQKMIVSRWKPILEQIKKTGNYSP